MNLSEGYRQPWTRMKYWEDVKVLRERKNG